MNEPRAQSSPETVYDDLPFHGVPVVYQAPPPVEIAESPWRFSLLQLMTLTTIVALISTLIHWLGLGSGVRLAVLLAAIAVYFYPYYLEWTAPRRLQ